MKLGVFLKKLKAKANGLFTKSNWNILVELTRANFKVSDYNSILGVFWSLLGPIVMLLVMYLLFRTFGEQEIKAYPLYLLLGIISVDFFVTTTTYTVKVLSVNRDIVLNSTVPRESLILSNVLTHVYKLIIELSLCLALSAFYGMFRWRFFLLLFPLLIAYIALALGVGLIILLVYCFARDIEHIWNIASRILFFGTPIFYTLDSVSPWIRKMIYFGNPLTPFLISFREIFMNGESFNMLTYIHSLLWGGGFFLLGYLVFINFENITVEQI